MKPVRKAVFPVAGFGTRFLPATKSVPKELLPVVDRPLIQYAVDEALAAGIEQMIFVTGRSKHAIEDYFDRAFEVEEDLQGKAKFELLEALSEALSEALTLPPLPRPPAGATRSAARCLLRWRPAATSPAACRPWRCRSGRARRP